MRQLFFGLILFGCLGADSGGGCGGAPPEAVDMAGPPAVTCQTGWNCMFQGQASCNDSICFQRLGGRCHGSITSAFGQSAYAKLVGCIRCSCGITQPSWVWGATTLAIQDVLPEQQRCVSYMLNLPINSGGCAGYAYICATVK